MEWNWYVSEEAEGAGMTYPEVMSATDARLESCHSWIQWAFPLPTGSAMIPGCPIVPEERLRSMSKEERSKMLLVLGKYQGFLARRLVWTGTPDHNWLRVSRVIQSMTLSGEGLERYAAAFADWCRQQTAHCPQALFSAWPHWDAAEKGRQLPR